MRLKLKQPTWRQPLWLSAIVLVGWVWDSALGHGGVSWVGWVAALVLVAGISALTVYSARLHPLLASEASDDVAVLGTVPARAERDEIPAVRIATQDDLAALPAIEQAADTLFEVAGFGAMPAPATMAELSDADLVLVIGEPAVGYLRVEVVNGAPHIEQVSVRPKSMKRGYGSALIEGACEWARSRGFGSITLCTFADVPWNGPWYARRGFVEISALSPALADLRQAEAEAGLDGLGRRVVMRKSLRESVGTHGG